MSILLFLNIWKSSASYLPQKSMIRKMSQNDLDAVNAIEVQAFQDPWSKQDL